MSDYSIVEHGVNPPPRARRLVLEAGYLDAVQKYVDRQARRHDLVMDILIMREMAAHPNTFLWLVRVHRGFRRTMRMRRI